MARSKKDKDKETSTASIVPLDMVNILNGTTIKNLDELNTFDSYIKQYDRCIDISQSLIYLHTDIEYGSLYDIMNNVNLILKCRPVERKNDPITISMNSFGGSVYEMFGIIDFIKNLPIKINVVVRGTAMSAAALILACATGTRSASKHSQIMLHELSSESTGKLADIKASTAHLETIELAGNKLLAEATGKPISFWESKMKKDFYLTPEQALELNVIDLIIE